MTTFPPIPTDLDPDSSLEVTVHIAARPETVFPYFTDPARYAQWMGTEAELDASPGGTYRSFMRDGVEASGQFLEVDPPRRIVFTWGWLDNPGVPPGTTRVEITLEPEDAGTLVRLRHHDLPGREACDHHRMGWETYLGRLRLVLAGEDPGPDPNASEPTA